MSARANGVTHVLLVLVLLALLGVLAMLARGAYGGGLDPSAAPSSTMQRLDDIPGAWNRTLNASNGLASGIDAGCFSDRFDCLWPIGGNYTAVYDRQTGLVWERVVTNDQPATFFAVVVTCTALRSTGDRLGWRLPRIEELQSLYVRSGGGWALPAGHPFTGTGATYYWSSSGGPASNQNYMIGFATGIADTATKGVTLPGQTLGVWCVRGGQGFVGAGLSAP